MYFRIISSINLAKIEKTKAYILETVAPIFNKQGYVGTSLSDLTKATGLTKGAIYGNFKNKEELAVQAFKLNLGRVVSSLNKELQKANSAREKLLRLTNYYRRYYEFTQDFGGCPIANAGADTNHTNPILFQFAKTASKRLEEGIQSIIEEGIENGEFRRRTDAEKEARVFFSMIEGAVLMASIQDERKYLTDMMNLLDSHIEKELNR
ncbi:MAG: TetR/AcrR family transcriptional regulator [Gracilimonas sp.]